MARISKTAEARQDEILDVAQRLFLERGYDDTSIQAIIQEVDIAKGTFYHHYPSKPAVLDALVARMVRQSLSLVQPILADPSLSAVEKLNRVFLNIGVWKSERRVLLLKMHRVIYAPANAQMRDQIQRESSDAMAPLIAGIIRDGVAEGVFDTPYPQVASRLVLEMGMVLGRTIGDALMKDQPPPMPLIREELDAYQDAVGRLLGAKPGTIHLVDPDLIPLWFQS